MELGKRLNEIRRENDLKQEDLANRYHVTRQTISNWETGRSYPDLETLVMISDDFDVPLDTLLKGDREMVSKVTKEQKNGRNYSKKIVALVLIGVIVTLAAVWLLSKWEIRMSPDNYSVTVKEITLDNVKVDEVNEIAVYTDIEGGGYLMEEDSGEGGYYEEPSPGAYVFRGEKYAQLMSQGYAYEVIVTSDKYVDLMEIHKGTDGNGNLEVYGKALNAFNGNKRKRAMAVTFDDLGKICDKDKVVWERS